MKDKYNYSDLFISTTTADTHDNDIEKETPSYLSPRYEIRLSIFFISALCVGVPCLIWAFYFVHRQRKTRGRISAFIILLLLSDLLRLLLYPYIVSKLFTFAFIHLFDIIILLVYFCLKVCGLHLQQLVALEGVLTLKYPLISARIFPAPCYIIFSIIILLFPLVFALLMVFGGRDYRLYLSIVSILASVCLLVVTGIITYKAPPTPARTPVTDNRPGAMLFLVTTVTLVVLYFPCVVSLYPSLRLVLVCDVSLLVEFDSDFRASAVCAGLQRESQHSDKKNTH